jgi:hypothetical protein
MGMPMPPSMDPAAQQAMQGGANPAGAMAALGNATPLSHAPGRGSRKSHKGGAKHMSKRRGRHRKR